MRRRLVPAQAVARSGLAGLTLLVLSAVWGSTFIVIKDAVASTGAASFVFWRFLVALVGLVALRPRSIRRIDRTTLQRGLVLGAVLAVGFLAQTTGLETTSAATSGFLTSLYAVEAPLLALAASRRRPSRRTLAVLGLALLGLAVISLHGGSLRAGDLLAVVGSLAFATQIAALALWSAGSDPFALTLVQLGVVAAVAGVAAAPSGLALPPSGADWAAVATTALLATTLALVAQTWAQGRLSTLRASLLMAFEPVFATLAGVAGGEPLSARVAVGGALIVLAIVSEVTAGEQTGPAPSRVGTRRRIRLRRLYTR